MDKRTRGVINMGAFVLGMALAALLFLLPGEMDKDKGDVPEIEAENVKVEIVVEDAEGK